MAPLYDELNYLNTLCKALKKGMFKYNLYTQDFEDAKYIQNRDIIRAILENSKVMSVASLQETALKI